MSELSVYAREVERRESSSVWALFVQDGAELSRVAPASDWLLSMRVSVSPNTVARRARGVTLWWRWCLDTGANPLAPILQNFVEFVEALQETPIRDPGTRQRLSLSSNVKALPGDPLLRESSTVHQRCQDVQEFYEWALEQHLVPKRNANQVLKFKIPTAPQGGLAPRLEPHQVKAMRAAQMHPRDRLFVECGYCAGLRAGETLGLHVEDIHDSAAVAEVFDCPRWHTFGPHLHVRQRAGLSTGVRAKGKAHAHTPRVVPMNRALVMAYRQWQYWCSQHLPEAVNSRFVLVKLSGKNRGGPLGYSTLYERWHDRIVKTPGLERSWPHLLRHTFASELADAGQDRAIIAELLGHKDPATSDIYTHRLAVAMVNAVETTSQWRNDTIGTL